MIDHSISECFREIEGWKGCHVEIPRERQMEKKSVIRKLRIEESIMSLARHGHS